MMPRILFAEIGSLREPVQEAKQRGARDLLRGIGRASNEGVAKHVPKVRDVLVEPVAWLSWQISECKCAILVTIGRPLKEFRSRSTRPKEFDWRYSVGA